MVVPTRRIFLHYNDWLTYLFSQPIRTSLEAGLYFPADNKLLKGKDHCCSCVTLNHPSPRQPWQIADAQGLGSVPPSAPHGLGTSIPMTEFHPNSSSERPFRPFELKQPPPVTLQLLIISFLLWICSIGHHLAVSYLSICFLFLPFFSPYTAKVTLRGENFSLLFTTLSPAPRKMSGSQISAERMNL